MTMKHVLAYPVWAAGHEMLEWVLHGIAENFDPECVMLAFYFDEVKSGMLNRFAGMADKHIRKFARVSTVSEMPVRDLACHNWFIRYLMTKVGADTLIVAQDDIRFNSPSVIKDLEAVLAKYGNDTGYIGMREGYGRHYAGIIGSPFDAKYAKAVELPPGEFREAMMMNPGPLVYTRSTVSKIGDLDASYRDWFWWDDYSLRALHNGLKNVVLSIDAQHKKFGDVRASTVAGDAEGWAPKDLAQLNERWAPHFGGSVI